MDSEREGQITSIFHSALARERGERRAYLDRACAGNDALRREVEMLIDSHERAGSFIDAPAYERAADLLEAQLPAGSLTGRMLGQYRLVSLLGAGGMGEVYLADDTRLERRVAIKVLPAHITADRAQVARFRQEARAASALNHPNIITVHDINESDGTQYIATEYIEGMTLRAYLSNGPLAVHEALDIAIQVAGALSAAHGAGVVHRDIKPENVMVRPDGYVKVLDFGIAKLTEKWRPSVDEEAPARELVETGKGVVMGTVHYMSPEQARGVSVDARTDIWSLGVVLYEMVSGRFAFEGETVSDCIASILKMELIPLSEITDDFPARLDLVVQKALQKELDERYQTAKELVSDLRAVRQETDASVQLERPARPESSARARPTASKVASSHRTSSLPESVASTASLAVADRRANRKRNAILTAGLIALLALGGFGYWSSRKESTPNSTAKAWTNKTHPVDVRQLTAIGNVEVAALSPDGNYFAYVLGPTDRSSLWFGHVSSSQRVELRPPDRAVYHGLTFAPDGNQIYYAVTDVANPRGALFRVPVMGGVPNKVLERINVPVTFSPDGRRLAFVRRDPDRKLALLIVANAEDGKDQQEIATRPLAQSFAAHGPSWSPDGKLIAVGGIQEELRANDEVLVVRVTDGHTETLGSQRWAGVRRVVWLRDGSGLLVNVIEKADFGERHIWLLDYPGGTPHKITSDLAQYGAQSLSVSDDGEKVLALRAQAVTNIWSGSVDDPAQSKQLTRNSLGKRDGDQGLAIAPDGRIVYSSNFDIRETLWVMNAEGGEARQLTPTGFLDRWPTVTRDARYVVFTSTRSGHWNIWRVGLDGSDIRQLTISGAAPVSPTVTMDSRWVIYEAESKIWKVSIDGGGPVPLVEHGVNPRVSPDGMTFACIYRAPGAAQKSLAVFPITGGNPLHLFDVQPANSFQSGLRWSPDGSRDCLPCGFGGRPLATRAKGGRPQKVLEQSDQAIFAFDWSPDQGTFVYALSTRPRDVVLMRYGR